MQGSIQLPHRQYLKRRTPSGRVTRAKEGEKEFAPTQAKRLRDAAMAQMASPEWGTELGRLFMQNTISAGMYAAGKRWTEWASRYRAQIGAFPIRSPSTEPGRGASPADPDTARGAAIAKREADHAERFFEAHAVLVSAGMMAENLVRRVCEQDEAPCGLSELAALRRGLMALVAHWGLDRPGKSDDHRGR